MSNPVEFQQEMSVLRQAYVEQLPTRIRQIETLWMAACNGTCTQAGLNTLYKAVHQLNGSGETFGLAEITASTHYLEAVVKNLLVQGRAPTPEERVKVLIELSVLKVYSVEPDTASPAPDLWLVSSPEPVPVLDEAFVAPAPPAEPLPTPTVLIADDGTFLRKKIALSLRAMGFCVYEVDNGLKALDKAREHLPDVILMDVMMPVMDGLEATRHIRKAESLREIPIIIMTVQNRFEDVQRAFVCGINDYILKPFRQDHLIERIKACLKRA